VLARVSHIMTTPATSDRAPQLDQVMADWSSEHEDYRVNDVRVSPEDGTITIDLAGPGEPPGLDALASDLRAVSSDALEVQVTWVPLERIVITD
jgi:hypothetical protein